MEDPNNLTDRIKKICEEYGHILELKSHIPFFDVYVCFTCGEEIYEPWSQQEIEKFHKAIFYNTE